MRSHGAQGNNHEHVASLSGGADELAVGTFGVEEHPDESREQQGIAQVGDGNAPWIAVHREITAAQVVVIAALIEAYACVAVDVVHRHEPLPLAVFVADSEATGVVGRRVCALMVVDGEVVKTDCEGQRQHPFVRSFSGKIGIRRFAESQMDDSLTRSEMRQQRSCQYDDERKVKQHGRKLSHPPVQEPCHGYSGEHCPE